MASDADLNPEQLEAVSYRGGPLLILAGAGTGKTRVIVHRIAALIGQGVDPSRILAVTFTNKAAQEMRHRVDSLVAGAGARVWVHTFHAFAAKLLRRHAEAAKLTPHFTVYDSTDQKRIITEVLAECGLADEKNKAGLYVSVISRAKDDLLDAQSYAIHAMAQGDAFRQNVAKVYERYQKKLDAAGGVDFGDLLLKVCGLMKENLELRGRYQKLFEQLLVDEYQDTNHAQYVLTKTLAAQHRNLCVVGDADQSIYAFRGANIRNILEFETDFKDAKVVKLERNYRSTPEILHAAGSVIANNRQRHAKSLWTKNASGAAVVVEEMPDERAEARWVLRRVVELAEQGVSFRDMAIFYRTNAQSRQFEEALSVASIPYRVVGSVRFYERKEIKDALAYARAAINPTDSVSLERVLNVPTRGIGKAAEDTLKLYARDHDLTLRAAIAKPDVITGLSSIARRGVAELDHVLTLLERDVQSMSPHEAMNAVLHRTGYWESIERELDADPNNRDIESRLGNLQELVNAIAEYSQRGTPEAPASLGTFLEEAALQSGADGYDAAAPSVTLMTVHLAKGLEFPAVFVTGLEEGLFPIQAANYSPDDLEEERRLCYVAMTRAKERLYLAHAATRRLFGRVTANLPSRFILEARLVSGAPAADPFSAPTAAPPRPAFAPESPNAPVPMLRVKSGMRVKHPEFGTGRVIETSGSGEGMRVTVHFDNGVARKLLVRYAPLLPA